jgi:hypothetical protein
MRAGVPIRSRMIRSAVALTAFGCAWLATQANAAAWSGQVEVLSNREYGDDVSSGYERQGALYSVKGDRAIWHAAYELHQEGGTLHCSDGSEEYYTDDIVGDGSGTNGSFALYLNGSEYSVSAASAESFHVDRSNSCDEQSTEFRSPFPADTSWSGHYLDTHDSNNPHGLADSISFKGNVGEKIKIGWNLKRGAKPPSTVPDHLLLRSGDWNVTLRCRPRRCHIEETCFDRFSCVEVSTPDAFLGVKGKRRQAIRLARGKARIRPWHTRALNLKTTRAGRKAIRKLLHRGRRRIKGKLKITDNTSAIASRTPLIIRLKR